MSVFPCITSPGYDKLLNISQSDRLKMECYFNLNFTKIIGENEHLLCIYCFFKFLLCSLNIFSVGYFEHLYVSEAITVFCWRWRKYLWYHFRSMKAVLELSELTSLLQKASLQVIKMYKGASWTPCYINGVPGVGLPTWPVCLITAQGCKGFCIRKGLRAVGQNLLWTRTLRIWSKLQMLHLYRDHRYNVSGSLTPTTLTTSTPGPWLRPRLRERLKCAVQK